MEVGDREINFLDLNIKIDAQRHHFKIYRKDTYTDNVIPADSKHPTNHKHAAFHSMIHRLLTVPLSDSNFHDELITIKSIAVNNGYTSKLVDALIKKKRKKLILPSLYSGHIKNNIKEDKKFTKIPFLGNISNICARLIKDSKPAFYTINSLKKFLINNKQKTPQMARNGVYQLKCSDCDATYIGQTGRSFTDRIKEHERSWRLGKEDSAFAQHLTTEGHAFDITNNVTTLHICDKGRKLDALEALEINKLKHQTQLLNDRTELNTSPLLNIFTNN